MAGAVSVAAGLGVAAGAGGLAAGGMGVAVGADRLTAAVAVAVAVAFLFPQAVSSRASGIRIEMESVSLNCDRCDWALAMIEAGCALAREEAVARWGDRRKIIAGNYQSARGVVCVRTSVGPPIIWLW